MKDLLDFIDKSPSCFHAVDNICKMLTKEGYTEISEADEWKIAPLGKYFVCRNDSSVIAFCVPGTEWNGFHMIASHSDSPAFKLKETPEMNVEEQYIKLNVEKYGGMILSTWMDRPLSIAGRVVVQKEGKLITKLVNIDKDLLVIPNVAIHMNRDMNKGVEYNPQIDMQPLFAGTRGKIQVLDMVAQSAGVEKEEILGSDLYLYVREKGKKVGANGEFICSARLDDLQCVYASVKAFLKANPEEYINVCAVFDNEEVGSATRQGADSTFLEDVLVRINKGCGGNRENYLRKVSSSFMISADNAHAVHPNHTEKADPTNRPYLNGGIVIKFHGSQKYTTDARSAAVIKSLCKEAEVPFQTYANRADIAGGSTLGNISAAHVSVSTVDVGLPQLAMHSAYETAGAEDEGYMEKVFMTFYSK